MSTPIVGLLVGMALGLAAALGGFGAFLLVAALGAVGFLAGRYFDGDLDLSELFSSRGRRR
ncbi:MAG: DUF2273 domain-containing protein [Streptomycetaceae bacterium]|jgi:hypothetical protein|uniref:DUF2273 domain-containing protein n=1 Tax=Yinghuangia soli TaxID=2908204 RepID=A0AA41U3S7_9ACTN|nr:hypothetical protein [Yinghuangia soli]MCF2533038.1 hypothetical protein [Yinghuangia soli]NUU23763.1 DUF2273 domain-containing protein [Streptomycetaceae bacterium]